MEQRSTEDKNELLVSNDIAALEPANIDTYQFPSSVPLYFRAVDNLPQPSSPHRAPLRPLTESQRLKSTSQFTTFLQHFITNCPSDTIRKLSKALPAIQKVIIDFSNSNISNFVDYWEANPFIIRSIEERENQPSTSMTIPLPSNIESAQLRIVKVGKRLRRTGAGQATSTKITDPRSNYQCCPFCSDLCTTSTALMWQNCSNCQFPVHFECDKQFMYYNPYICITCRNNPLV